MGSREVSPHTKDSPQDNRTPIRGEGSLAKGQVHWLDDSSTRPDETPAHTDSAGRERNPMRLLGSPQKDRPDSPEKPPLRRDATLFRELGQKALGRLWQGKRLETSRVSTDSKATRVSTDSKATRVSTDSKATQVSEIGRDMAKIDRGKTLSDGRGKIEQLEIEHHQDLFNQLKARHAKLDSIEKDMEGKGVEHDDYSLLSGEAEELKKEISALREELEEGRLKEEVRTWYREQNEKIEHHQDLFNQLKAKHEEMDKIIEGAGRGDIKGKGVENDGDNPLSKKVDKLIDEMDALGNELGKGPLKYQVEAWYQNKEMKYHQKLFNELQEKEKEINEIDRNLSRETWSEMNRQSDHPILQEIERIRGEMDSLEEELGEGPLKEEVQEWNRQAPERDKEYHRELFNELKVKELELYEMKSSPVSKLSPSEVIETEKVIDGIKAIIEEGLLKDEMQNWYKQRDIEMNA